MKGGRSEGKGEGMKERRRNEGRNEGEMEGVKERGRNEGKGKE